MYDNNLMRLKKSKLEFSLNTVCYVYYEKSVLENLLNLLIFNGFLLIDVYNVRWLKVCPDEGTLGKRRI